MKIFKHIGGFTKKWDPLKMNKKKNLRCNKHSTDCRLQSMRMLFNDDKIYDHMAIAQYIKIDKDDDIKFYMNEGMSDEWGIKSHFNNDAFKSGSMEYKKNVENFKNNIIACFKIMKPGYARIHTIYWNDKTITKNDLDGDERKYHVVIFARDKINNLFILDPKHHNIFKNSDIFNSNIWGKSVGIGGIPPYLSEEIYKKSEKNFLKIKPVIKKSNEPGSLDLDNLKQEEKELNDDIIVKLNTGQNELSQIEADAFKEFKKSPDILILLNDAIRNKDKVCAKEVFINDKKLKDAYDIKLDNIIKMIYCENWLKKTDNKMVEKKCRNIIEKAKSNQKIINNFIEKRIEYINESGETKKEDISLTDLEEIIIPKKEKHYFPKTARILESFKNSVYNSVYEKKMELEIFMESMFPNKEFNDDEMTQLNELGELDKLDELDELDHITHNPLSETKLDRSEARGVSKKKKGKKKEQTKKRKKKGKKKEQTKKRKKKGKKKEQTKKGKKKEQTKKGKKKEQTKKRKKKKNKKKEKINKNI